MVSLLYLSKIGSIKSSKSIVFANPSLMANSLKGTSLSLIVARYPTNGRTLGCMMLWTYALVTVSLCTSTYSAGMSVMVICRLLYGLYSHSRMLSVPPSAVSHEIFFTQYSGLSRQVCIFLPSRTRSAKCVSSPALGWSSKNLFVSITTTFIPRLLSKVGLCPR